MIRTDVYSCKRMACSHLGSSSSQISLNEALAGCHIDLSGPLSEFQNETDDFLPDPGIANEQEGSSDSSNLSGHSSFNSSRSSGNAGDVNTLSINTNPSPINSLRPSVESISDPEGDLSETSVDCCHGILSPSLSASSEEILGDIDVNRTIPSFSTLPGLNPTAGVDISSQPSTGRPDNTSAGGPLQANKHTEVNGIRAPGEWRSFECSNAPGALLNPLQMNHGLDDDTGALRQQAFQSQTGPSVRSLEQTEASLGLNMSHSRPHQKPNVKPMTLKKGGKITKASKNVRGRSVSLGSVSECSMEYEDDPEDSTVGSTTDSVEMDYFYPNDGPCTSSNLAISSMNSSKKDKLCLVCGDKALGYNFNAVSCESCKAFFRRNAHKSIRGRCEGKCDVTVESRSFCKRCRLAKCFVVGMRKDMILNDEQKRQRKQKIIINKLRRQGQLPPQDTYSASAKDLLGTVRGVVAKNPDQFLASQSSYSPPGLVIKRELLDSISSPGSTTSPSEPFGTQGPAFPSPGHYPSQTGTPIYPSSSSTPEAVISYTPWEESQDQVEAAINMMSDSDQFLIRELMQAMESGSFLVMSSSSMKMIPTNPEAFVNMAELFVRKVIKVAKNIIFFKRLDKGDQIALLKGSVVDIMMLRSAVNYDPFTESWSLNTEGCLNQGSSQATGERISAEILKSGSEETKQLFMTYSKFIKSLMSTIHGDLLALKILILMSLFSADRVPMVDHRKVQEIQETYARILEEYISLRFNQEPTLFARVVMKLTDLRNINEVHSKMLLGMKVDEFEPLLLEIFDLPTDVDGLKKDPESAEAISSSSAAPTSSSL